MQILITGATGFLGREVVAAAVASGHEVVALRRPASAAQTVGSGDGITWVSADLRTPGNLKAALLGVEAVIHCAAAPTGDLATQLAGTVLATENLLDSLPEDLKRIVHVSSFSVYDFNAPRFLGVLCENTPLEPQPARRDAYTQTKLMQELLVRSFARKRNVPLVVARPGAIYGPGKTWDFGAGLSLGRFDLIFAPLSRMRLIHVGNCADALVAAVSAPVNGEVVVNLVDAEQPSHWRFHRLSRRAGISTGIGIPVPYVGVLLFGIAARMCSRLFFGGRARLPEFLDLARQQVRWRPLRYSREQAQDLLNVSQRISLSAGISQMDYLPDPSVTNTERG